MMGRSRPFVLLGRPFIGRAFLFPRNTTLIDQWLKPSHEARKRGSAAMACSGSLFCAVWFCAVCGLCLWLLAVVLSLELEKRVQALAIVGVIGKFGGEGTAELDGLRKEGVGAEVTSGRSMAAQVLGFSCENLNKLKAV